MRLQPLGSHAGPPPVKVVQGVAGGRYTRVNTLPQWRELRDELMIRKIFAVDTETTAINWVVAKLVGISFSWGAEHSYYVPVGHTTSEKQLKLEDILDDLIAIFGRYDLTIVGHNIKYDLHILLNHGIEFKGIAHDTLILHKLLREEGSAELKDLAVKEIHPQANKWESAIEKWRTKKGRERIPAPLPGKPNRKVMLKKANVHYGMVPIDMMVPYAASDTHYTWALFKKKLPLVAADPDLRQLYLMESRLLWVLLDMEHQGVLIDREYLREAGPDLDRQADELEEKIRKYFNDPELNVGSADQLVAALLAKGITWDKKTSSGKKLALDVEVLDRLATKYQVCEDIVACRKARKLRSTYVDGLASKLDDNNYLHCSYNQNVVTGRMSSSGPNLQNIPAKTDTIRKAFISPEGFIMVFIDYSQVEVRMTAHYSQDPVLVSAYTVPPFRDVHTNTMCEVFDLDYDEAVDILVDENHPRHGELSLLRKVAKTTNFLVIYGGGAENLRAKISTPKKQYTKAQCKKFIDKYFSRLRVLQRWIGRTKREVRINHQVQNYFGRYRRLAILGEQLPDSKQWMKAQAERQAVNFLIQGTCADLFKIAMVRVADLLRERKAKSRLIMTIHDEIVLYMHKSEIHLLDEIKAVMEDWDFTVPIVADISYAVNNWAEKKELHLAA